MGKTVPESVLFEGGSKEITDGACLKCLSSVSMHALTQNPVRSHLTDPAAGTPACAR
jgi:hypothetical protein